MNGGLSALGHRRYAVFGELYLFRSTEGALILGYKYAYDNKLTGEVHCDGTGNATDAITCS